MHICASFQLLGNLPSFNDLLNYSDNGTESSAESSRRILLLIPPEPVPLPSGSHFIIDWTSCEFVMIEFREFSKFLIGILGTSASLSSRRDSGRERSY